MKSQKDRTDSAPCWQRGLLPNSSPPLPILSPSPFGGPHSGCPMLSSTRAGIWPEDRPGSVLPADGRTERGRGFPDSHSPEPSAQPARVPAGVSEAAAREAGLEGA